MKKLILIISGLLAVQIAHAAPPAGGDPFDKLLLRCDANNSGTITKDEFKGPELLFNRLDKNQDGELTRAEFEAAQNNRAAEPRPTGSRASTGNGLKGVRTVKDLEYANVDGQSLKLDLYLPENSPSRPALLVWIHGGGWKNGDKANVNPAILRLSESGYAIASINYRLEDVSIHPKNIHDCKGAVRWLRAHAAEYGFDPQRIAICGSSAGGHLALLLGMSSGVEHLEGTVGGNPEQAGPVRAIIDLYGPSDLPQMAGQSRRFNTAHTATDELLADASPLAYLSPDDPPVLIFHGDQDNTVPKEQSLVLNERYQRAGLESELHILPGAGHGGMVFSSEDTYQLIKTFLDKHLGVE